jgi:3'-5' exoribonuclease
VNSRRLPGPRDWIGPAPYPWPAAGTLPAGAVLVACYSLVSVQFLRTRQDKPYAKLQLTDAFGPVEARIWDDADRFEAWLRSGMYVGVRGRVEIFNGERQLKVEDVAPIQVDPEDLELFLPRSRRDPAIMERELRQLVASVTDTGLRGLLRRMLGPETETGRAFRRSPAAKQNHHATIGGLLEHSLSVTQVCDKLARHYGAAIDRDLLITAALLHDVGKIREIDAGAGFAYTDEGKLLGHILLGLEMVSHAATAVPIPARRLLLLQHLIASHQGRYEWQSPREPRILEGLLLHYADDLDAKVEQAQTLLADVNEGWTPYSRSFGRDLFRHRGEDEAPPPREPEPEPDSPPPPLDLFGTP